MVDWNDEASVQAHYNATSRIVCACNRVTGPDGQEYLLIGARHWDSHMRNQMDTLIAKWKLEGYEKPAKGLIYEHNIGFDQGFIDQYHNYHDRTDALAIAKKRGQIFRRVGGDETQLYSENLY